MKAILVSALLVVLAQPVVPRIRHSTFRTAEVGSMLYALSIPDGYDASRPRPLVLALHPGGERTPYYGSAFLRGVVAPALSDLDAILVAPDCPTRAWSDPATERAVLALLQSVMDDYAVDRRRILVTGFSLGGRGTWFMAARHSDFFTAAIPIAGAVGSEPPDKLGTIPTYVIHSRNDEVVPFAPAERLARDLEEQGRAVKFEALTGLGHFQMRGYVEPLRRAGAWVAERWAQ